MLQAVAKQVAQARLPLDRVVGSGVVLAFLWLLFQDRIHPMVVYLLELYLSL